MRVAFSAFAVLCAATVILGITAAQTQCASTPKLPLRWNASVGPSGTTNVRIRNIGDHTVLVGARGYDVNATIKAYRANNGTALWSYPLSTNSLFADEVIIAGSDYFGAFVAPGNVATVVNATGAVAWTLQLPSTAKPKSIAVSAATKASDVTIAVVTTEGLTIARGGSIVREIPGLWAEFAVINTAASVVVANQILSSVGSESCLVALKLSSGQPLWNVSSPGITLGEGATWSTDRFVAATTFSGAQLYALSNGELISDVPFPAGSGQFVVGAVAGPSSVMYVSTWGLPAVLERHPEIRRIACPMKRAAAARALVQAKGANSYPTTVSAWSSSTSQMWNYTTWATVSHVGVSLDRLLVGVGTGAGFVLLDGVAGTQVGVAGPVHGDGTLNRPLFLGQSAFFTAALESNTMSLVAVDVANDNNTRR